jgi:colicin import membrane protein
MTAAALQVHPEPGKLESAALAALVHLLLFALLFFGVQWQSTQPDAVTVELWSQLPVPEPAAIARPEPVVEPMP